MFPLKISEIDQAAHNTSVHLTFSGDITMFSHFTAASPITHYSVDIGLNGMSDRAAACDPRADAKDAPICTTSGRVQQCIMASRRKKAGIVADPQAGSPAKRVACWQCFHMFPTIELTELAYEIVITKGGNLFHTGMR